MGIELGPRKSHDKHDYEISQRVVAETGSGEHFIGVTLISTEGYGYITNLTAHIDVSGGPALQAKGIHIGFTPRVPGAPAEMLDANAVHLNMTVNGLKVPFSCGHLFTLLSPPPPR